MTFGGKLRALRKEKGLTQAELAKMVGVNVYSVKMWEGNYFEPNAGNLRAICLALGCSAEELIGGKIDLNFDVPNDRVVFIDEVMKMSDRDLQRLIKYYELIKNSRQGSGEQS